MNKKQLRLKYKTLRAQLSSEEIENRSLEIANNLLKLDIWTYSFYHIFLSISEKKEVDTQPVLHILQGKDKNIAVSKTQFHTRTLQHFLLTDATVIKINSWGIPEPVASIEIEPAQIEVIFIPLLAFDLHGNRIGYGKGFYDRFLKSCSPEAVKIGLSFFAAEEEIISDIHAEDVPLDYCITPEKIYNFRTKQNFESTAKR